MRKKQEFVYMLLYTTFRFFDSLFRNPVVYSGEVYLFYPLPTKMTNKQNCTVQQNEKNFTLSPKINRPN